MNIMNTLASKIIKLRREAGISSKELAERSGMSTASISKIENGRQVNLSLITSRQIADGLNLTLKDFLDKIGFLEEHEQLPAFRLIGQALRGDGFSQEMVEEILGYAEYLKEKNRKKQ